MESATRPGGGLSNPEPQANWQVFCTFSLYIQPVAVTKCCKRCTKNTASTFPQARQVNFCPNVDFMVYVISNDAGVVFLPVTAKAPPQKKTKRMSSGSLLGIRLYICLWLSILPPGWDLRYYMCWHSRYCMLTDGNASFKYFTTYNIIFSSVLRSYPFPRTSCVVYAYASNGDSRNCASMLSSNREPLILSTSTVQWLLHNMK